MKRQSKYTTEAALCKDFIAWAAGEGWTAYPETRGYDIVLVDSAGRQFGIQAKLQANVKVLAQICGADMTWIRGPIEGPDFVGVLIPARSREMREVCDALGATCFCPNEDYTGKKSFAPGFDYATRDELVRPYESRLTLPNYVPDVVAGSPSPLQLTDWKIKALRIVAILELRGWVTRDDFKSLNLSFQRWPVSGWIKFDSTVKRYHRGEKLDFDKQHPAVYAQIKAELVAAGGAA